ncbi:hypothetical protein LUZ60_005976 [Juncus effusus]|nr:hypothetical protein LUZ60_005976 [Juncus effusus]
MISAIDREMNALMGYSSEEELSVLPVHTKVVVTGNNRTKSVLVGLKGVVKKAVGLGGWHWLMLTNGIEVKLQRNALTVIEGPTGNETDENNNAFLCENLHWNFASDIGSDDTISPKRPQKPRSKPNRASSVHNKSLNNQNSFNITSHNSLSSFESQSKDSDNSSSLSIPRVDMSKLETTALWRYWHHFNLDSNPNPSKEQLIEAVQSHFMSQQLDELQVITGFVKAAKRLKKLYN